MSSDLEKKQSPFSSSPGLTTDSRVAYDEPHEEKEETLHRGLKARQVSQSFILHSLGLYLG